MGKLKRKTVRRAGTNRREFIRRAGGAAVVLGAATMLPACGGSSHGDPVAVPPGSGLFRHGVASGDPLADRVILWTRVTPDTAGTQAVECVVATDVALANVVAQASLSTDAARDYTVKTDITGLQPNTTYYYRFTTAGVNSPIGRTRTIPSGAATRLRMAVVSCGSLADGYFNAYRRVAERADLDLVVHLGDYIYETADGDIRIHEPAAETVTLSDYRTRHGQYKRDADLQELHRQHPVIAIWDDHDVAGDAHHSGAENHSEGPEGTWTARVAAALQAYHEWMPVRVADPTDLRKGNRSFAYGDLVDLLILDQRLQARSPQLPGNIGNTSVFTQSGAYLDPTRQMIGSDAEAWLATRLRTSTAKWKLVGQGVMFAQLKIQPSSNADGGGRYISSDQWDGYQPARDRVYEILKGNGAALPVHNVVLLTGDAHSSWAADLTQDPNNEDVASGGYDKSTGSGSHAVEFVTTSVTSPTYLDTFGAGESLLRSFNPHFKYIDLTEHGYMLVDADADRVVAEWWYVDSVTSPHGGQWFETAFAVFEGTNRLIQFGPTSARVNPPALAPG